MLISLIVSANITDSYGFNVLAAQLKRLQHKNIKVQLFYIFYKYNEYYPQTVVDELIQLCKGSDLIGVSLLSSAFRNSIQITKALKSNIDCPIIWGGKHPTADPEECVKYADIVVLSEGEDTLFEIIDNMISGKSYDEIKGTWVKKDGKIIKNPLRPIEMNLDRFLFPDYSLKNKFVLDKKSARIRPMESKDLAGLRQWYPTMITRGCPNCCTFCTNSTDFRLRKMRARSIGNVIKEITEFLKISPDTEKIFFRDDCLSAMPLEFIKEFAKRWKKEVNLPCSCSGVIANSDNFKEKIKLLSDAGFINFKMGIQSGCERVRRFVFARVKETDEVIEKAILALHSVCRGKINYYMITDNPYESEDELIQSIRFTSRIARPFALSLFSLNFYPGTALYYKAFRDGVLNNKEEALQESTMDFKNTYLNKVFISLKFFAIPPFLARMLTNKKIYKNALYQKAYNKIFKFLFNSDVPSRRIKPPKSPSLKIKGNSVHETARWIAWGAIRWPFNLYHYIIRL